MDENNQMTPQGNGGGSSKKVGIGLLVTAIVLCLFSDLIPGPIDDVIGVILGILSGRALF